MPQAILDPRKVTEVSGVWTPSEPLPLAVRTFGYVPDIAQWRPGDLLLFSKIKPGPLQRAIIATHRRGYNDDHARWHHAAVYIGDFRVCEATAMGVGVDEIYKYLSGPVSGYLIRARRCPLLADNQASSYAVVVAALIRLKRSYSYMAAATVWWRSLLGFWKLHFAMAEPRSHICSHLYADSFSQATGRPLEGCGNLPSPAHLSATKSLEEVPSQWKQLAN